VAALQLCPTGVAPAPESSAVSAISVAPGVDAASGPGSQNHAPIDIGSARPPIDISHSPTPKADETSPAPSDEKKLLGKGGASARKKKTGQTHTRTKAVDLAPYTSILSDAIKSFPGQHAYLCEIYGYLQQHFPCFKNAPDHRWKNSVRHNLSIHQEFRRVAPKEGQRRRQMADSQSKGAAGFWTVVESAAQTLVGGDHEDPAAADSAESLSQSRSPLGVANPAKARKQPKRKPRAGVQKAASAATGGGRVRRRSTSASPATGSSPAPLSPGQSTTSGSNPSSPSADRDDASIENNADDDDRWAGADKSVAGDENLTQIAALLLQLSDRAAGSP